MTVDLSDSARCPDHPESAAVNTCARCGRFLCAICAADSSPARCPACAEREPASLFPGPVALARVPAVTLQLYVRALPLLLLISLVSTAASMAVDKLAGEAPSAMGTLASSSVLFLVQLVCGIAELVVLRRALGGPEVSAGRLGIALIGPVLLLDIFTGILLAAFSVAVGFGLGPERLPGLSTAGAIVIQLLVEPLFDLWAAAVALAHPGGLRALRGWMAGRAPRVLGLALACVAITLVADRLLSQLIDAVVPAAGAGALVVTGVTSMVSGTIAALRPAAFLALVCWLQATRAARG